MASTVFSSPGYPMSESVWEIFCAVSGAAKSMAINFLNKFAPMPEYPSKGLSPALIVEKHPPQDRLSIFKTARLNFWVSDFSAMTNPVIKIRTNPIKPKMIYFVVFTLSSKYLGFLSIGF